MANEQLDEFEKRVVALIRHKLQNMEKDHPGYETGDFVLTFEYWTPPGDDDTVEPWQGGRYAGWWPNGMTFGSSDAWHVDLRLLSDAYGHTDRKYNEWLESDEADDSGA